ncbi:hypothetical protein AGMMS49521_3980 [Campylobacterota bacterium]|nr:hypothetical protein AGMMS49521_3980 [Campylobacterota bacterium]
MIITHPHADHIYDLPALQKKLTPEILIRPKDSFDIVPSKDTPLYRAIAECANKMNRDHNSHENSFKQPNIDGVDFEIIIPPLSETSKDDLNTFSIIVIVTYRGYKFVLTGDNPKSILQKMMDCNKDNFKQKIADATVLLAPHHGRTGEFCKGFFSCVNPILTVVSDKSIVHTTQEETSSFYKGSGAKLYGRYRYVLTTRNDGTITFRIADANNCTVSMNEEGY